MYLDYFGLKCEPFSINPDPRFLFMSERHREALAHLLYGIHSEGGFVLLTGDIGTGKTTICRCLLEQLPEKSEVVLLLNPKLSVPELLASICDELRISYPSRTRSIKVFVDAINAFLLDAHSRGHNTVIIIDEAQNLRDDVLEQIRLLTNLETTTHKLLQVILLGQPELREMLNRPELRQLAQRITARYHLLPLSPAEVANYVAQRLSVAGGQLPIFPPSTIRTLYRLSDGVPRVINILCSRALLGAYAQGEHTVRPALMTVAAGEVLDHTPTARSLRKIALFAGCLLMLVLSCGWAVLWTRYLDSAPPAVPAIEMTVPTVELNAEVTGTKAELVPVDKWLSHPISSLFSNFIPGNIWHMPAFKFVERLDPDDSISFTGNRERVAEPSGWIKTLSVVSGEALAYQALFRIWGMEYRPDSDISPEESATGKGLALLVLKGSFSYVLRLNRPAILKLTSPTGKDFYAALIAIDGEKVVLQKGTEQQEVAVSDLLRQWFGDFTLLWQPPPGYRRVIMPGDRGKAVYWLARQLDVLHGRAADPGTEAVYSEQLLREVQAFQAAEGLSADGLVGPLTLIRLNSRTGGGQPQLVKSTTKSTLHISSSSMNKVPK